MRNRGRRRSGRGEAGLLMAIGISLACVLPAGVGCSRPRFPNAEAQCPPGVHPPACPSPYTFESMAMNPGNTDEVFVCLTFSGGGTRAAALAYGVLAELRDTDIPPLPGGSSRSLLDEVDIISSVSGGSFTAMAFKYWGERLFESPFANRFLYANVTRDLVARIILQNLFILPIIFPDRIHIAANYVNEQIFDHAVYAGLSRQRPFVVVNATSMAGERFEFTQDDFDMLGSDLNSVPLGHAVMASSAYPLLLSPMRLKYYANDLSTWTIRQALDGPDAAERSPRRHRWATNIALHGDDGCVLDEENRCFVYLLDGGIWDNLGLAHVIGSFQADSIRRRMEAAEPARRIRKLVVIAVDAATALPDGIESRRVAPGLLEMAGRSASIGVSSHCDTTMQLAKCLFEESPRTDTGCSGYLIDISLKNVSDPETRQDLLALPTRLDLDRKEVDALIIAGRKLLREHPKFEQLRRDMK